MSTGWLARRLLPLPLTAPLLSSHSTLQLSSYSTSLFLSLTPSLISQFIPYFISLFLTLSTFTCSSVPTHPYTSRIRTRTHTNTHLALTQPSTSKYSGWATRPIHPPAHTQTHKHTHAHTHTNTLIHTHTHALHLSMLSMCRANTHSYTCMRTHCTSRCSPCVGPGWCARSPPPDGCAPPAHTYIYTHTHTHTHTHTTHHTQAHEDRQHK